MKKSVKSKAVSYFIYISSGRQFDCQNLSKPCQGEEEAFILARSVWRSRGIAQGKVLIVSWNGKTGVPVSSTKGNLKKGAVRIETLHEMWGRLNVTVTC